MYLLLVTNVSKKNVKTRCQYKTTLLLLYRRLPIRVKVDAFCEQILAFAREFNGTAN
jgi:hypothetical protein